MSLLIGQVIDLIELKVFLIVRVKSNYMLFIIIAKSTRKHKERILQ